jgi:hypothetical protein
MGKIFSRSGTENEANGLVEQQWGCLPYGAKRNA